MSPDTRSFEIARFWSRTMPTKAKRRAHLYIANREMLEWIDQDPFLGGYDLRLEAVNSEYDTGLIEWAMTIVYDHPDDAVQHRMRW